MFSFLGLRNKDSKKSTSEKEVDGGFVIIGETVEEQRRKMPQTVNMAQPATYVIVQPSKPSCTVPAQSADTRPRAPLPPVAFPTQVFPPTGPSAVEAPSTLQDLLEDVPFTLAPHVLAMQTGFSLIPDVLLARDINYNLTSFQYDFTLENSVLQNA